MAVTMPPAPIEPVVADRRGLMTMPGLQQDWIRLQDTVGQLPYQLSQQFGGGAPSHDQSEPYLRAETQEGGSTSVQQWKVGTVTMPGTVDARGNGANTAFASSCSRLFRPSNERRLLAVHWFNPPLLFMFIKL